MKWKKISVEIPNDFDEEIISDVLMKVGAQGTEIIDNDDSSVHLNYGEIYDAKAQLPFVTVNAYFDEDNFSQKIVTDLTEEINNLNNFGFDVSNVAVKTSDLDDADWENNWKQYYHPIHISRYLTVVPQWVNYEAQDKETTIIMDPGKSFGTGTHPTTFTCMQALELILGDAKSMYDVGTGSGILSIQARKLGVKDITAFDLDPEAVEAAKLNLQLNDDCKDIEVFKNSLLDGVDGKVDVIVANILADIILQFVPDIQKHLNPNGFVILSGIINEKEQQITDAMEKQGFGVIEVFHLKGWSTLICKQQKDIEAQNGAILR
ncbi:50S ribosomal protein L11 methyltransferase [Companilactobacillus sp.]|jgi:ribosomal protein L11 methyltransferase|uniref:50S ribosomal protein L11 methyltransferase n=1 Tax=Companilactobacillus sp. TaxID=2767905 RepID=UPI0025C51CCB|nr:50S ribosomal protein L11 methyltransferase [Companilactobacillus sp.]MCH4008201.1 50S ribosomal protein L11 methyltransferase [Companilactobacillus sp.]MCH4051620.1 50S ribosomal protein L11 methyltransferase [Companilactobacillus sp.]MCH4076144.1 50S ribosomal protein L11 methyltransferase [Companilactobacillus sp.]MCH4124719.1 50S ribosomal protein L11 methyltransferase [Companilactobacillus sp.]MCH4131261.1 50S ribosomal protein L11 methyltransferase [Companilactobacillus sp.]